ncbi:MAG: Serine/threonine protein phosphatase [uncultured Sulfurovum sp.]|uniref:Serine/threonine protein phosphatase n=1 Tax=uncultured Sulfurovum sp. TaxID=269237 RepID=A0A6S6U709_9BACT|nr:MAG: Serine/threonine protein phosphatase [uncultured Sulfurovum sp.]
MAQNHHYIIGDVHGEYPMLLALIDKLPKDAKLIFVGDLVNRGRQSREVVEFARNNAHAVIKGNHEGYLLEHGKNILEALKKSDDANLSNLWNYIGGVQMLWSYKLLRRSKENPFGIIRNHEGIAALKSDLAWIKALPLTLELGELTNYSLPVVISHGSIGDYWHLKESHPDMFEMHVLSNRIPPSKESPIFNIYGHEVVPTVVQGETFISLDTGCGKYHDGKLSAYCLETKEIFEVFK